MCVRQDRNRNREWTLPQAPRVERNTEAARGTVTEPEIASKPILSTWMGLPTQYSKTTVNTLKKKKKRREKRAARATAVLENGTGSELKRAYKRRSNYRCNLYVDYSRPLVRATFSRNLGHTTNSSTTSNTFVNDDTQTKKTFTSKLTATSPSLTWCKLQIASFQFLL